MKHLYLLLLALFIAPAVGYCHSADTLIARWFVGAGINSVTTKLYGDSEPLAGTKSGPTISPEINAGANFFFDNQPRRWFAKVNFSYTQTKGAFYANGITTLAQPVTFDYHFTQKIIALNLQVGFNFINTQAYKFFITTGAGVDYGIYSNMDHNATVYPTSGAPTVVAQQPIPVSNIFLNAQVGIGVLLNNRIEIYFKDIPSYSFTYRTSSTNTSLSSPSYRAGVNFYFGR